MAGEHEQAILNKVNEKCFGDDYYFSPLDQIALTDKIYKYGFRYDAGQMPK